MIKLKSLIITTEMIKESISNEMRIHSSSKPITSIDENKKYKQSIQETPNGFWYGFGDSWKSYADSSSKIGGMNPKFYKFFKRTNNYEVILEENANILKLDSKEKVLNFTEEYGVPGKLYSVDGTLIDWSIISSKYSGIEFNPYFGKKSIDANVDYINWYDTISVPSGCVWDMNSIKSIKSLFGQ